MFAMRAALIAAFLTTTLGLVAPPPGIKKHEYIYGPYWKNVSKTPGSVTKNTDGNKNSENSKANRDQAQQHHSLRSTRITGSTEANRRENRVQQESR